MVTVCFKKTKEMRFTSCTDILCSLSMVACTVQQESRALLMITKRVLSLLSFCFNDLYLYIYPHSLRSPPPILFLITRNFPLYYSNNITQSYLLLTIVRLLFSYESNLRNKIVSFLSYVLVHISNRAHI